jgi:hypothetical protein
MPPTVPTFVVIVSGEHTRTIQIATPTVGGLMKFAVKTVTCLGCKTPLRANNSVSSTTRIACAAHTTLIHSRLLVDGAVCDNCRPRISELYQKQVRFLSYWLAPPITFAQNSRTAGSYDISNTGKIRQTLDAMSTVPRISPSGETERSKKLVSGDRMIDDRRTLSRMSCARARIVRSFICGRKRRRTSKMAFPCLNGLMTNSGNLYYPLGTFSSRGPHCHSCILGHTALVNSLHRLGYTIRRSFSHAM